MKTGLVTTARVTHATPAALYAKTAHRDWECDTQMPDNSHPEVSEGRFQKKMNNKSWRPGGCDLVNFVDHSLKSKVLQKSLRSPPEVLQKSFRTKNFKVLSFSKVVASVTDRQTHRQTHRQTDRLTYGLLWLLSQPKKKGGGGSFFSF